jgi:putative flippase GtrA
VPKRPYNEFEKQGLEGLDLGLELNQSWLRSHAFMLFRYLLAGSLTSLVYIIVYNGTLALYSRGDLSSVTNSWVRFMCSNCGYICALLVQYSAHSHFTFQHRVSQDGQLARYLIAVGFGFVMAGTFSSANLVLYTLPDSLVSLIVMILVAVSNFLFFNFWVYSNNKKTVNTLKEKKKNDSSST